MCTGRVQGKPCGWVVNKRPDGKSALCNRCDARRLIIGATRALEEFGEFREEEIPAELDKQLGEAEERFANGRFIQAVQAARRLFALLAKIDVETELACVEEAELPERAREVYEEVLEAYEAERFFDAKRSLQRLGEIQQIEAEFAKVDEAQLGLYAQQAYGEARAAFEAGKLDEAGEALVRVSHINSRESELAAERELSHSRSHNNPDRKRQRRQYNAGWRDRIQPKDSGRHSRRFNDR